LSAEIRGHGDFDDASLIYALASLPLDEGSWCPLDPGLLNNYNEFYCLQFIDEDRRLAIMENSGERIAIQAFLPSSREIRAWALVCHGYYDHVGLYGHLIGDLLSRDIAVVAFDQPGHGLSTGDRANIDDFQRYVDVIRIAHKFASRIAGDKPLHWFGQSMGGALVMEYWRQAEPQKPSGEIVLLAPLVRPYAWPLLRWVFEFFKRIVVARPRNMVTNMVNEEFVNLIALDPLQAKVLPVQWIQAMVNWFTGFERYPISQQPINIVQGYEDRTVSFRHNLKILNRLYPNAAIHIIPQARHHLVNETPIIYRQIWTWLDDVCEWYVAKA
jgi:alpha-beta hydrolase superfamily lysophospholipase